MKVRLATNNDKQLLLKIKEVLIEKWINSKTSTQELAKKFDEKVSKRGDEYIYGALLNQKGEVLIVAALFLEYKITRGLSQIYHLEIEYKKCSQPEELFFQQEIVQMIPGYKITGLNVVDSKIFSPYQVYMEINIPKGNKLRGSL